MSNKILFVLILIFTLFSVSCQNDENNYVINYSITSPKVDWKYNSDLKILLAVNIDTQEITWKSSIDGFLGNGNHLLVFLTAGNHTITADVLGTEKSINILISENNTSHGEEIKTLINYSPLQRIYPNGTHYPYFINFDGSIKGFKKNNDIQKKELQKRTMFNENKVFIARDLYLNKSDKLEIIKKNIARIIPINKIYPMLGDIRTFYVPNTSSQNILPHEIPAVLFYSSDKLNVWIPASEDIDKVLLLDCILTIEKTILCRLNQIWGTVADIDEDDHFTILISKTINDEKTAIGFFNPSDFYRRETDITSDAYNPNSNEMDMVYIAVPDNGSTSYNKESIIATIVHEITHAMTYTQKSWKKELMGQKNVKREELFLDEGLSHLSEILCGCGYSGGTVKYLQRYLENTAHYSVCDVNIYGQVDSIGMRGAITLFLSWLFWEKGGISYNDTDYNLIIDNGGINFLKTLINSDGIGWENIGKIAGAKTDKLFEKMTAQINYLRLDNSPYQFKTDILTSEPIEIFPGISYNGIIIDFPARYNIFQPIDIGRWSIVFFEPLFLNNTNIITFLSTYQTGNSYLVTTYSSMDIK